MQGGLVEELAGLHLYSPVYVLGNGEGEAQEVAVVLQHFLALHALDPGAFEGLRVAVVSGTGSLQILQVHSSWRRRRWILGLDMFPTFMRTP